MSLDTNNPVSNREDRNVGEIYDRLDAAQRQREDILETPAPANDDRRTVSMPPRRRRPFPKLKPPRRENLGSGAARSWDWATPWALGLAIFILIFVFAVR